MATYVCLLDWTQKGIENVKDSPKRLDAARESVKAAGGEIRHFYMTNGKHDMVLVVDAKDDETLAKALLKLPRRAASGRRRCEHSRKRSTARFSAPCSCRALAPEDASVVSIKAGCRECRDALRGSLAALRLRRSSPVANRRGIRNNT